MINTMTTEAQGLKNDRSFVNINVGELVCHQRAVYRITQVLDFSSILGINVETGKPSVLRIAELKPFLGNKIIGPYADSDLEEIGAGS